MTAGARPTAVPVIDAATQAGANHIESVQYTVKDPQALRAEALKEAAAKARASAEVLASALNLKIVRIVAVDAAHDSDLLPGDAAGTTQRAPDGPGFGPEPTPVPPASFSVTVNVTLTVEVGAR